MALQFLDILFSDFGWILVAIFIIALPLLFVLLAYWVSRSVKKENNKAS